MNALLAPIEAVLVRIVAPGFRKKRLDKLDIRDIIERKWLAGPGEQPGWQR
jgi:hypothetical protein